MAKKERTFRVAVAFLPSMSTHREMADGVSRFASEHGNWLLHTIVTRPDNSTDLSSLDPSEFDGAIGDFALPPFNRIVANGVSIPLVVVDPDLLDYGTPDHLQSCGRLVCDNASVANAAADALLARQAAAYAYVGLRHSCYWSRVRERVFSSRVRAAGAKCAVYRAAEGISFEEDVAALGRFLKKLPKPAAAFVACDVRAQELLSACRLAKLTVPNDLAVLSVDDDESICLCTTPTLSSIRQNAEHGGYLAAAALDKALRESRHLSRKPIRYGFASIAERASTATSLHFDALTERTLRLISDLIQMPGGKIRVADLVQPLGASRRTLEYHFKQATGRTLHDEIIAMRLRRVKQLLTDTHATLQDIAEQTGFSSASHLTETFRRAYGDSPGVFRLKASRIILPSARIQSTRMTSN